MNKNSIIKRLISILLCVTITLINISNTSVFAQSQQYDKEFMKLREKIQTEYKNGMLAQDIIVNLSDSEKELLLDF